MGVPAFFRWLSRKYPSIVANANEERPKEVDDTTIPVDTTQPNPNGVEFDNLYLDMNGIIHPCSHPEDKPAPRNEAEIMLAIFQYIDRLFSIIRPRRLLYMAVDGVAPRAKMNQQRSRRFRAAKDSADEREEIEKIRDMLTVQGIPLPAPKAAEEHFDSNCITPGTPFMGRLSYCLRYYIHDRLNSDPGWQNVQVILSDANVPGEGEHKIMDYIRRQRASPSHDPNTHHCLCGADADLIMLGLATHEPLFTIIREEFIPNQQRPCKLCGQYGHEMKDCKGLAKEKVGEHGEVSTPFQKEKNFIFIRLNVLREYLTKELDMRNLPFKYDFERAIDDWVFMCFFVGNDFLPHLPSLEIREGAIDRLVKLYKSAVYKIGGYITDSGIVNLNRVQVILNELGKVEDEIFKTRQDNELRFRQRNKDRKRRMRAQTAPSFIPQNAFAPTRAGNLPNSVQNPRQVAYEMRMQGGKSGHDSPNQDAAKRLKQSMGQGNEPRGEKRSFSKMLDDSDSEEEPVDDVKLYEAGWKERYYQSKFEISADDLSFRYGVAAAYVEGLCWVLQYYYQGCPSWKWFFPYHYAPFASDFVNIASVSGEFARDTKPFKPMEQLMGVFPAASRAHVPESWRSLMTDPESAIYDFYPENFEIDLNGKKWAWQGVALLPFVEEGRLLEVLEDVYPLITEDEQKRNVNGFDRLFVAPKFKAFQFGKELYDTSAENWVQLDPSLTYGMAGKVMIDEEATMPGEVLKAPVEGCPEVPGNKSLCIMFRDPQFPDRFLFKSARLSGAKEPPKTLKPGDWSEKRDGQYRLQIGMSRGGPRGGLGAPGHRMLGAAIGNQYGNVPPPMDWSYQGRGGRDRSYSDDLRWGARGASSYNQGYGGQYNARDGGYGGGGGYNSSSRSNRPQPLFSMREAIDSQIRREGSYRQPMYPQPQQGFDQRQAWTGGPQRGDMMQQQGYGGRGGQGRGGGSRYGRPSAADYF